MNIKDLCSAELIREDRKSLSVRVFPDLRVVVKVPIQASEEEVARFVTKKRSWIKKQLDYFQQFCNCMHLTKLSGSSMLYLGRQYQVIVQKDLQKYIKIEKNKIVVHVPFIDKDVENQDFLNGWLIERANAVFAERLKAIYAMFDKMPLPNVKVRKLTRRWGSYMRKNHTVILNPCLIQASKSAIDFIIAHELCHYYYKEHNTSFYNLLESKVPNWRQTEAKMEQKILANS